MLSVSRLGQTIVAMRAIPKILDLRWRREQPSAVSDRLMSNEVRRARERLSLLSRWYAARPPGSTAFEMDELISADVELERVSRTSRIDLVGEVDRRAGPFD